MLMISRIPAQRNGHTRAAIVVDPRVYPLARPTTDDRFTPELLADVARVLVAHGYPDPSAAADRRRLGRSLFECLYGARRGAVR